MGVELDAEVEGTRWKARTEQEDSNACTFNQSADGAAPRTALHHRESVGNEPHLGLSTRGGAQQAPFLCHTQHRAVASARSEAAGLASSRRARKAMDAAVVQKASATLSKKLSSDAGYTA